MGCCFVIYILISFYIETNGSKKNRLIRHYRRRMKTEYNHYNEDEEFLGSLRRAVTGASRHRHHRGDYGGGNHASNPMATMSPMQKMMTGHHSAHLNEENYYNQYDDDDLYNGYYSYDDLMSNYYENALLNNYYNNLCNQYYY